MKRDIRRQQIMELLGDEGTVEVDALCRRFAVSKMTIYRDLDDLERDGVLRRIRGGVTIESELEVEGDYRTRERQNHEVRSVISEKALELIEPGMTIMIADGTLAASLGALLPSKAPLTVITNNAALIDSLRDEAGINLIALGGSYSPKYNAFFGVLTEHNIISLRADLAFLVAPAVSGNQAYHMDSDVVRTKRAMLERAIKSCLMVAESKFNRVALHVLADLEEFDWVITDKLPDPAVKRELDNRGIKLTLAK